MVWLMSQNFIASTAYGPRENDHIFNMHEINKLINNLKQDFDLDKLFLYSIPEINQWKTRNTKEKYTLFYFKLLGYNIVKQESLATEHAPLLVFNLLIFI